MHATRPVQSELTTTPPSIDISSHYLGLGSHYLGPPRSLAVRPRPFFPCSRCSPLSWLGPPPFAVSDPHLSQNSPSPRGGAHTCPPYSARRGLSEIGGVTSETSIKPARRGPTLFFRGGVKKPMASKWHQQPLYRWMIRKINVSLFDGSQWNPSNESLVRK